jgi:RHS repeat-associated protein
MDPMGSEVSYVHDAAELVHVERHEPLGVTRLEHDRRCQRPTRITAPDGNVVEMRYDAQGRLLAVALGGDTLADPTRSYAYDDASIPAAQEVSYRIDAGTRLRTVTYVDGRAKPIQKRVERAPGEVITSGWITRNPWGQTVTEHEPTVEATLAFAIPDLEGRPARSFRYDSEGRPVRTVDYGGGVSTARYLPFDIEQRDANDNDDSPANIARGLHDTPRREQVDAVGRRILIEESLGGGLVRHTRFTTGAAGELLAIEDALGQVTRLRYDRRGNRLEVVHRDAGTRRLWHDAAGRAVRTVDARGTTIEASYDALGRLLELLADGTIVEQYTYDDLATGGFSRLREVVYPGGRQRFEYDRRGQVTRHEHAFDGHAEVWALAFEYDGMGKQTAVIHPDGTRVTQRNDKNGMVRQIDGIVDEVLYDARGLPISVRYANGVHTTLAYESGPGKVRHQRTVGAGGQLLQDASYGYDRLQMVLTIDDQAPGGIRNVRYDYDPLQQLTRARGEAPGGDFDASYGYVNGRSLAELGEIDTTLRFDDPAHPDHVTEVRRGSLAPFAPSYDTNGNMVALPGRTLVYDHKNQVVRVTRDDGTIIDYAYDHRGQRIRKRVTRMAGVTTETLMLGAHAEVRNGQLVRFVLLGKARVALHWAGSTLWIHTDPLGSASVFSDAVGVGVSRISYQAFGNVRSTTGTPASQSFGGHEFDADAGLYFMGRRCYAPDLGRFVTPDPLYLLRPETADGDPAPLSLYGYVGNDPTNRIDPNGLSFWSVFGAIVGVIVGVVLAVVVIAAFVCGIGWGLLVLAGAIGLLTAGYMGARELAGSDGGEFLRGMLIGINAGANFVLATLVFSLMLGPIAGLIIGITLGVINFLAAFDTIAQSEVYQGILGWTSWFMPMSWLVIGLGVTMWVLNVLGYLFTFGQVDALRIDGMRVDWKTGTIFTKGGWISNLNAWDTAFNMGNFAFVDTNFNDPNWAMEHEAGHNLNLAAYGSIFHFIGFVDELISGGSAFSEQLAEGNDPAATGPTLPQWT